MNGDFGGFTIANFADHDDIGVLPENRPEACSKRQVDLGIDLHLAHAKQLILHRIFDGYDVLIRCIDVSQRRIECRRLSASGRSGHKNDAVR